MADIDLAASLHRVLVEKEIATLVQAASPRIDVSELERSLHLRADEILFELSKPTSELDDAAAALQQRRSQINVATSDENMSALLGLGILGMLVTLSIFGVSVWRKGPLATAVGKAFPQIWSQGRGHSCGGRPRRSFWRP